MHTTFWLSKQPSGVDFSHICDLKLFQTLSTQTTCSWVLTFVISIGLNDICQNILDNEELYSEENAFELFMDAFMIKNEKIMDIMLPRIQNFYLTLANNKDFVKLPQEVVSRLLQSSFICVHRYNKNHPPNNILNK